MNSFNLRNTAFIAAFVLLFLNIGKIFSCDDQNFNCTPWVSAHTPQFTQIDGCSFLVYYQTRTCTNPTPSHEVQVDHIETLENTTCTATTDDIISSAVKLITGSMNCIFPFDCHDVTVYDTL
ncbi:MAG: hypothetical protein NT007_07800 [Candidatus Kapabacteria bacterium]|nr:hypothetical protein [Candidatus Kapabacteria bacterium]